MRRFGTPTKRKDPLSVLDLHQVTRHYQSSRVHDDLLFVSQLLTGFTALMRLGELVFPDTVAHRDFRKVSTHQSLVLYDDHFSFLLPSHKADRFFEGNTIIVKQLTDTPDSLPFFRSCLSS